MAQKVLFPGTHMRITQDEYGVTSHKGSLARDDGGESTTFDSPVLAPFDGYFTRVRTDSSHETYFVSDEPVECANGYVGIITFLFMTKIFISAFSHTYENKYIQLYTFS